MKSCCFTGHREHKLNLDENSISALKEVLFITIEQLCKSGITDFYTGMAKGIDLWAALAVITLKKSYPINLHGVIPFAGQEKSWSLENQAEYAYVLDNCTTTHVISPSYSKFCFLLRNKYMVNNSDIVFAVYNGTTGGTKFTINYAQKQNRKTIILNPKTLEINTPISLNIFQ